MAAKRERPWFAVKRIGYGVGLPIAWEGWLVLFLYLAIAVFSPFLLPPLAMVALLFLSTAAFVGICYAKSDEAWRWRSGD